MSSIRDRVWGALGIITQGTLEKQVSEAFQTGYREAANDYADGGEDEPASGDIRKYGYRRTTRGLRDFSDIDRERVLEIVWTLYQSNPVAARSQEIKRDYILGRGVSYQARDEKLQAILDDFWRVNKMSQRIKEFTLQLFLFGSQLLTVFVRQTDGRVRLGYIDPLEIEEVVPHPENSMELWAVVVKSRVATSAWERHTPQRVYRVIREEENLASNYGAWLQGWDRDSSSIGEPVQALDGPAGQDGDSAPGPGQHRTDTEGKLVTASQANLEPWEQEMLEAYGLSEYSGSCIYTRVNSVSNQPYGYSDLLQVADWLDQLDETLFSIADREQFAAYFSWDVTLKGASEKVVKKRRAELQHKAPKRGTVNVHNEAEEWQMNHPQLGQTGSIETARALQNHSFGGLGFPEAWFGRGDETNRATLQAQGDPTWRTLEHDQDKVRDMILDILELVRDQAELAGTWSPTQDTQDPLPLADDVLSRGQASPVSQNGRSEIGPGEREAGVPDLGSKLTGKIISDEVDDDGTGSGDDKIDLDDVKQVDPREITVTMPEMTARDLSMVATMLSTVASALVVAEEQGWQDKGKSVEIWAKALSEFGIDLDVSAVRKALEQKQQNERDGHDSDKLRSALGRHGVMVPDESPDGSGAPSNWDNMSPDQKEIVLEAFMNAVGVERIPKRLLELVY